MRALAVISDVIEGETIEVMDELRKAKTSVYIVSGDNLSEKTFSIVKQNIFWAFFL